MAAQALVNLLEHFLLAAPIITIHLHRYIGNEYFVPCMLNAPSGQKPSVFKSLFHKQQPKAEPVHLVFDTQYVPPGFFVRLLVVLNRNCKLLYSKKLDRYTVTVAYEDVNEITLKEHSESIVVEVIRVTEGGLHVPDFPTSCRKILELLDRSITEIHKWLPSVRMNTAFECKHCRTPRHFAIFDQSTPSSHLRCQKHKIYSPTTQQKYWLKPVGEQHSALDSRVSFYILYSGTRSISCLFTCRYTLFHLCQEPDPRQAFKMQRQW